MSECTRRIVNHDTLLKQDRRYLMGTNEIVSMLPADLRTELEARIEMGEFKSADDLIQAALRYYFERHSSKDLVSYVDEEIRTAFDGSA